MGLRAAVIESRSTKRLQRDAPSYPQLFAVRESSDHQLSDPGHVGFAEVEMERDPQHASGQGFGDRHRTVGPVGEGRLAVTSLTPPAPGLDALGAGLQASGRWCLANGPIAQLMFWRPVPSFEPTSDSMAPSVEMVQLQRRALADAVASGQLGADADSDEAVYVVSVFISGVIGQAIANEPQLPWGKGRFTPLLPKLVKLLAALYPPGPGAPSG